MERAASKLNIEIQMITDHYEQYADKFYFTDSNTYLQE